MKKRKIFGKQSFKLYDMKIKSFFKAVVAVSMLINLSACGSTQMISSWVSPDLKDSTVVNKILVFSLLGGQKVEIQKQFEDAVVAQLSKSGANAVSAFDLFGPEMLKNKQADEIAKKIQESGCSGILLMTLLDKSRQTTYVPGSVYPVAVPAYYPWFPRFYGCYSYYYGVVSTPGYFTTDTNYIVVSRLYYIYNEKDAVYIVETETTNPGSLSDMATGVAKIITGDMNAKGLIPSAGK